MGGRDRCYSIEKKTRIFVDEVLKFVCKNINNGDADPIVYTDVETEIVLFSKTIRPDYCIMRS